VVGSSRRLTGGVPQSDISDKVAENKCPAWMKISDIMTYELSSATVEKTLEDRLRLMEQNSIFHLMTIGWASMAWPSRTTFESLPQTKKARADLLESFIYPQRWRAPECGVCAHSKGQVGHCGLPALEI